MERFLLNGAASPEDLGLLFWKVRGLDKASEFSSASNTLQF